MLGVFSFFTPMVIVGTQNMAIGLNLYLDSQSICIVGFGFPIMGDPMLSNLITLLFPQVFLLTESLPYYLCVLVLFSQRFSQNCQPPFPHSLLLFIG